MKKKPHGTRTTYNAGCRCEECRQANNAYMAQYRRNQPKNPAPRGRCAWAPWEDELASDYTKSAWQIANILARTPAAVKNRRRLLLSRKNNQ